MILCPKCGKVDKYYKREYLKRDFIINEDVIIDSVKETVYKYDEPRCINCHRLVEFFKDLDEVE